MKRRSSKIIGKRKTNLLGLREGIRDRMQGLEKSRRKLGTRRMKRWSRESFLTGRGDYTVGGLHKGQRAESHHLEVSGK